VAERVRALLVLAEVLEARGRDHAAGARSDAIAELHAKGNSAAIASLGGDASPT
jgi:hypothetical protein